MFERLKRENGYIYASDIFEGLFVIGIAIFIIFIITAFFGGLHLDFASGSHRIIPTAVDNDMWGNYKVYYRTTEYTKNSEEDYYYIDKSNTELAEQMRAYIKQGKEVIVYYEKYVGFKGFTAPRQAPITKIEVIEN